LVSTPLLTSAVGRCDTLAHRTQSDVGRPGVTPPVNERQDGSVVVVLTEVLRSQRDEAIGWLLSADGSAASRRLADRHRLPAAVADDLVQEAATRLVVAFGGREEPFEDGFVAGAYARRVLQTVTLDLLRGDRRRPVVNNDSAHGDETSSGLLDPLSAMADRGVDVTELALSPLIEDGCRRALAGLLAPQPWAGAAALVVITLGCHPDVSPRPDTPAPTGGAGDEQALVWAGLHYAGEHACFPAEGAADTAAIRQRRSRRIAAVRALLADAAGVAGLSPPVRRG
jgi:hypothetical protein